MSFYLTACFFTIVVEDFDSKPTTAIPTAMYDSSFTSRTCYEYHSPSMNVQLLFPFLIISAIISQPFIIFSPEMNIFTRLIGYRILHRIDPFVWPNLMTPEPIFLAKYFPKVKFQWAFTFSLNVHMEFPDASPCYWQA